MICLFTDASFDPQLQNGVIGYLKVESDRFEDAKDRDHLILTQFISEPTSSRMELRAVIWALESMTPENAPISLYTDYESVLKLRDRRRKLEERSFQSLKKGSELANADLYRRLFELFDIFSPELYWIKGHKPKSDRNAADFLLSLVDKKTREILRNSR